MARSRRAGRTLVVDLHGYDVVTALQLARSRVAEAYRNGVAEVELVHGAADVAEPRPEGRGRIKWELRRMLEEGAFDAYCERGGTWVKAGSILLSVKPNASPRQRAWTPPPPAPYR
ncbi:MAG: hypothetical protein ACREPI_05380 [Candidatus Dormibacterales bacterium]